MQIISKNFIKNETFFDKILLFIYRKNKTEYHYLGVTNDKWEIRKITYDIIVIYKLIGELNEYF